MIKELFKKNKFLYKFALIIREWRDSNSFTDGRNNKIKCKGVRVKNKIQIKGHNNIIIIGKNTVLLKGILKIIGSNNIIDIENNSCLEDVELWIEGDNNSIEIGHDTYIGHHTHIACTEKEKTIKIGSNSMISSYVQIRTGDSHSILNLSGERINPAKNVEILDHCWIGQGATVLKGAKIEQNSVVATKAVVTDRFKPNVLIGGAPAKVLKNEIDWTDKRI